MNPWDKLRIYGATDWAAVRRFWENFKEAKKNDPAEYRRLRLLLEERRLKSLARPPDTPDFNKRPTVAPPRLTNRQTGVE